MPDMYKYLVPKCERGARYGCPAGETGDTVPTALRWVAVSVPACAGFTIADPTRLSAYLSRLAYCYVHDTVQQVMERAFIYQGKLKGKRVRPARIYYIRSLDQKFYRITGGGGSEN